MPFNDLSFSLLKFFFCCSSPLQSLHASFYPRSVRQFKIFTVNAYDYNFVLKKSLLLYPKRSSLIDLKNLVPESSLFLPPYLIAAGMATVVKAMCIVCSSKQSLGD